MPQGLAKSYIYIEAPIRELIILVGILLKFEGNRIICLLLYIYIYIKIVIIFFFIG